MGCDIHVVIEEQQSNGRWVGLVASDRVPKRPLYAQRDYTFFGAVANVRESGPHFAKGLPFDVSELAWHLFCRSPTVHHHPSYMPLELFCSIHNTLRPKESRTEYAVEDLTGVYADEAGPLRAVFWFDN